MYGQVVNQYYRYMLHVANNLIGVYNTTSAPEQNTKMLQIPPVEKAKAVVPFLKAQLFEKPEWLVNVPYADRIFANPDDQLQSVANRILPSLISTYRIGQLNPNYGAANYLSDLKNAIFTSLRTSTPASPWTTTTASCSASLSTHFAANIPVCATPPLTMLSPQC